MKHNSLIIGDDQYQLSKAYREGARAMRAQVPVIFNPYSDGSQANFDWDYGHTNEAAGEHLVKGVDVITAPSKGLIYSKTHPAAV